MTHHVPPPASWAAPCEEQLIELDDYINLEDSLEAGRTYQVFVNGQLTATFSRPRPDFPHSVISEADVIEAELQILEIFPPQYDLRVTYGIPAGSGCSQENGYSTRLTDGDTIEIGLTYHGVAPSEEPIMCITDYPIGEVTVPLSFRFESGKEYTVKVNGEEKATFVAE